MEAFSSLVIECALVVRQIRTTRLQIVRICRTYRFF